MASLRAWKTLTIQPYDKRLRVYRSRKALDAALVSLSEDPDGYNDKLLGVCWEVEHNDRKQYLLGWFDGKHSTLVHELGHLCFQVLCAAGINPSDSDGEAFCYLLDHLAQQLGIDS